MSDATKNVVREKVGTTGFVSQMEIFCKEKSFVYPNIPYLYLQLEF